MNGYKKTGVFFIFITIIPLALALNYDSVSFKNKNDQVIQKIQLLKSKKQKNEVVDKNNYLINQKQDPLKIMAKLKELYKKSGIHPDSYNIDEENKIETQFKCKQKDFINFIQFFYKDGIKLKIDEILFESSRELISTRIKVSDALHDNSRICKLPASLFYQEKIERINEDSHSVKKEAVLKTSDENKNKIEEKCEVIGRVTTSQGNFSYIKSSDGKIKKIKE